MRGREARELRRERAEEIVRARATRTAEQQLASLDDRLGEGVGATKERARLQREIDDRAPKPSPSTSPSPSTTSRRDRASKAKERRSEQRASARRGARAGRKS